jgi:hypothetical protein
MTGDRRKGKFKVERGSISATQAVREIGSEHNAVAESKRPPECGVAVRNAFHA